MPLQTIPTITEFAKYFTPFQMPGFSVDKLVAAQTRNVEALTAAAQLTAESWQTLFRRQTELVTQFVQQAPGSLTDALSVGTPEDKLAQGVDLVTSTLENSLSNFREMSDLIAKSNSEATDVLVKRVTESLAELKTAPAPVPAPKKKA